MNLKAIFIGPLLLLCVISCKNVVEERPTPYQMEFATSAAREEIRSNDTIDHISDEVYVCQSATAKRYHRNENCRGIKQCKHSIERTTVKRAEAVGLTICKFED